MQHALILKALILPLVASLVVCGAVVVLHPLRNSATSSGQALSRKSPATGSMPDSLVVEESDPESDYEPARQSVPLDMPSDRQPVTSSESENAPNAVSDQPATKATLAAKAKRQVYEDAATATAELELSMERNMPVGVEPHAETAAVELPVTDARNFGSEEPTDQTEFAKWEAIAPEKWNEYQKELTDRVPQVGSPVSTALANSTGNLAQLWQRGSSSQPSAEPSQTEDRVAQVHSTQPVATQAAVRPQRIRIVNPAVNRYPVAFLLGTTVTTLPAGQSAEQVAERVIVRFDRGNGRGAVTRELEAGIYEFSVSASGWSLEPLATNP